MDKQSVFIPKLIRKREPLAPGHRACIGCGEALAVRQVCKEMGHNVIVINATGCMEIIASQMPSTSWTVPWMHTLFENASAVASGCEAGLKVMRRKGRGPSQYVKVVAIGGDGATSDIGLQALSGALKRGHDFLYICFDNEAYMNTGVQQSSATPFGASTTTGPAGEKSVGQPSWKKNMPAIVAAHDIPYVATACPSYFNDLITKVRKAVSVKGPAYIQVLSVCPTGWRCPTDQTIRLGRIAVETGMFPLYEVINGKYKLNLDLPKLSPVRDYLKAQGRFRHLTDREIDLIQTKVEEDYARLKSLSGISDAPVVPRPAGTCAGESQGESTAGLPALQETVDGILGRYRNDPALLISILQDLQAAYNYLPKEAMEQVGRGLKIPLSQVYSVATFFKAFSLKPRGRNLIHVCLGTACHVRGAARLRDKIQRVLNIEPGGTTPDFKFSLETVNCVGACALGPIVMVNGTYHGQMTAHKLDALLKSCI